MLGAPQGFRNGRLSSPPRSRPAFTPVSAAAFICFALFSLSIFFATLNPYLGASAARFTGLSTALDSRSLSAADADESGKMAIAGSSADADVFEPSLPAAPTAPVAPLAPQTDRKEPASDANTGCVASFGDNKADRSSDAAACPIAPGANASASSTAPLIAADASAMVRGGSMPSAPGSEKWAEYVREDIAEAGEEAERLSIAEEHWTDSAEEAARLTHAEARWSDDAEEDEEAERLAHAEEPFNLWLNLPERFGSETIDDVDWCPGSREAEAAAHAPLTVQDGAGKGREPQTLFILGAQKAGTTWLFNVLEQHSAFNGATHAYAQRPGPWRKEVHFFNRWPPQNVSEFLDCFAPSALKSSVMYDTPIRYDVTAVPTRRRRTRASRKLALGSRMVPETTKAVTLVDATPEYLFNAHAPARIKQALPNARFVVILRDPVARVYSAWKMTRRTLCPQLEKASRLAPESSCKVKPFLESVQNEHIALRRGPGCLFDEPTDQTWGSCFRCFYSHVNQTACSALPEDERAAAGACGQPQSFTSLDVGNYAPQLAWWLRFFPPEQFLVLTSHELRDRESQVQALNRVRLHAGLGSTPPFTHDMLDEADAYDGHYTTSALTEAEQEGISLLRDIYRAPLQQLKLLLHTAFNMTSFDGLYPEL